MSKPSIWKMFTRIQTTVTIISVAAIVAITGGTLWLIQATEPVAQKSGAMRKSAALVEVLELKPGNYRPVITSLGTVKASQEIKLSPQINGRIIALAKNFIPGGFVDTGDILVEIEPDDYQNQLAIRESELLQAKAQLELEKGQQVAAQKEFELLGDELDEANRALVLREPHIRIAEAKVFSAKAMCDLARLNLERTKIRAPFDGQIIDRQVNLGSQISPGDNLASIVGIQEYWVIASVSQENLRWINLPENELEGATVTIAKPAIWGELQTRTGRVSHLIGSLDSRTRLARLLITVDDPLAQTADAPPLLLDTVVETHIRGKELKAVFRLNRKYIHAGDTVWVMKDGTLDIRPVSIVFSDSEYAYIRNGIEEGEPIVITNLATVSQGIPLSLNEKSSKREGAK